MNVAPAVLKVDWLFNRNLIVIFLICFAACNNNDPNSDGAPVSDTMDEESRHLPENALKSLQVAEGLVVTAMATEPVLRNPTNIDVDERGRIWVTEAYNYRPEINGNPTNAAGDRVLILSDKDGDGKAETSKVFYQGPEINAPLGVCVLGNRVFVSQSPYVWIFFDDNGDDSADRKEVLFQGIGGEQHDHGMHTFIAGPDGKLYFNFGNEGKTLKDKNGRVVRDQDGDEIGPGKYRQGMVFRCDPDGSNVECLGQNFRNNYELAVDSYGTIWQSDNDDDGNRSVRINYVMDYGNYGYQDELTGAGWQSPRTNMEDSIMFRHWHLNDPGVVPNLLQTGAGSPTGMVMYEGDLLPESFRNQVIHADPGVNIVRAYPVQKSGAGFTASIINLLDGSRDKWFRPSDICVAPDGSLIVADWYDPGVGGHQAGDQQRGRIYRVAPEGKKYTLPNLDYSTPAGAVAALQNPNLAVRYRAWTALNNMGNNAKPELEKLWHSAGNTRMRARAFWVLVKMPDGKKYINEAVEDAVPEIRMMGIRASRQAKDNKLLIGVVTKLANDKDQQVRRECAIALRHNNDPQSPAIWATLASQHDGRDRWYVEALGIGADRQWDPFFKKYLELMPNPIQSDGGKDIVWRARTDQAVPFIAQLASDSTQPLTGRLKYFRAFDFNSGSAKSRYLLQLLTSNFGRDTAITKLVLRHLDSKTIYASDTARKALEDVLQQVVNTSEFVDLARRYEYRQAAPALLEMALAPHEDQWLGSRAVALVLEFNGRNIVQQAIRESDTTKARNLFRALGRVGSKESINILQEVMLSRAYDLQKSRLAAMSLGGSFSGEDHVLVMLENKKIPQSLIPFAVDGLQHAWRKAIYTKARTYLPGASKTEQQAAAPTINELTALTANAANGKKVFSTYCSICHVAGGEGQNFGPNLSQIGNKLAKESLLESIVHPSAGISFGYETWQVNMKDGSMYTGIISSRTETDIDLKMPGGVIQKIKTADVKNTVQKDESMMPAMYQSMSKQELADLIAYLESLKK
jgi:putative membrane-bound dehydrogenase-like protein